MNDRILHALTFCLGPDGFWGLPAIFWGEPGTGKSAAIAKLAAALNMPYERLSPGERGEGAFGVVPVPTADGFLSYPPPDWTKKFTTERGGLLFADEANLAPPAIQGAMLGLVQFRTIGSYTLPKRTRVFAAANETKDAAGGWDLAPPLANRFGHFEFSGLDASDWAVGLIGGFANQSTGETENAAEEEERVLSVWQGAIAEARGLVAAFIGRRPELLHKPPQRSSRAITRAWPSRRSVEYAAHALAAARAHNLSEIDTDDLLTGFVGSGWAAEFATWRVNADLPAPADVLDGTVKFKHDPRRIDRTIAVLSSCAALVIPLNATKRVDRGNMCWSLIDSVLSDAPDAAVSSARALISGGMVAGKFPKSRDPLATLRPILIAGGVGRMGGQ